MSRILHKLSLFLPLVFFAVAVLLMHHEIREHRLSEIGDIIRSIPVSTILLACALTFVNFIVLGFYDWLGVRYAGHKVPLHKIFLASSVAYAISNNAGHALVSGTSVRYRFYTSWGIPGWEIIKISVFLAVTFVIGALTLQVGTFNFIPDESIKALPTPWLLTAATVFSAISLMAFWAVVLFIRHPFTIRGLRIDPPHPLLALAQTLTSSLDIIIAASILYVILLQNITISFPEFLAIYVVAIILGLASQVPGGLGVFEGVFLLMMRSELPTAEILASLVVYRIIYYFLPLAFAGVALFIHEVRMNWARLNKGGQIMAGILKAIIPQIFAPLLFATGTMLLISGALPALPEKIHWLQNLVPLSVLEFSHLLSAFIGVLLLFLARGIFLRLDAAYYGCLLALMAGVVTSLLKGWEWREAVTLGVMILLFAPTRRYFDRRSSLLKIDFPLAWALMILAILASVSATGFLAYQNIDYANDLWTNFEYKADVSRFLRAFAILAALTGAYILYRLFGAVHEHEIEDPTPDDLIQAKKLALASNDTHSWLALLNDKKLFWNKNRTAFIMYAPTPRYWISMSDPVGDKASFEDLLWDFRADADRHGAHAVFYEVSEECIPLYLDLGLVLLKMGEEARTFLPDFTLQGGDWEHQRKHRNKFNKSGFSIRVLTPDELEQAIPKLTEISNLWLEAKSVAEKGFSLGFFDLDYLRRTTVVVAEKDNEIKAFANYWTLDSREEIAIDMMRYHPDSPSNIMEYLFIEMMVKTRDEGYRWFDLGMAPLAGLEEHSLAPLWHKIGKFIYSHGEEFYNFEGLKAYKQKFDPVWRPRYLATPAGLHVPVVLMTIASVISGSIKNILRK